ncbi:MAG: peptidyl-alpha-hydroxyglycine alpha-amidating lyase family protein [Lachnospiraceae bacterium]|nr:peptidyl-alpha-hydroxyglycine alpha-amidating lyase family protein [Lachnospiraceae bacterium]
MYFGSGDFVYEYVEGWGQENTSFKEVAGISVDSEDHVYVLTRTETPVYVMTKDGVVLETFGQGIFGRAHGLYRNREGFLFCVDDKFHTVYKFSPKKELVLTLGTRGLASDTGYVCKDYKSVVLRAAGPFNRPTRLTADLDHNLYVTDGYGNARVHKFDSKGNLLFSWGQPGSGPGQFNLPHGIGIDRNGILYVADRQNNRVQLFDTSGKYLDEWNTFSRPSDVWVDENDLIYVSECLRSSHFTEVPSRISILNREGQLLTRLEDPNAFYDPRLGHHCVHGLAVDSEGSIYVGNVGRNLPENYCGLAKYRRI